MINQGGNMKKRTFKTLLISLLFLLSLQIFAAADRSLGTLLDDVIITTSLKFKLINDPSISAFDVGVTSNHGEVIIIGTLDSKTQAEALAEMANSIPGVKKVDISNLKVRESKQPLGDTAITTKIKALFLTNKLTSKKDVPALGIGVETNNGVVYLSGKVDNADQANNAISIAKSVDGVKGVESRLQIIAKEPEKVLENSKPLNP